MFSSMRLTAVAALALISSTAAQTHSDCDPTKQDGCKPNAALGTLAAFDWKSTQADSDVWNTTAAANLAYGSTGAEFRISSKSDSPTLTSKFYILFGRVSVVMKAASGDGIVSSVVMMSDDLDEIDFEWIGGDTTHVQSNFFGKGDTTSYDRGGTHAVDDTLKEHNYTVIWTKDQIDWLIDGNKVRTTKFTDSNAMSKGNDSKPGDRYPQTPMTVKLGNWPGGDSSIAQEGVVKWAHNYTGATTIDYSKGPFVQYIRTVEVQDYTKGKEYVYSDKSGSWQSITVVNGTSEIADTIQNPRGIVNKFNALPSTAKIGIAIGAASVAGILLLLLAFCCIKQKRAGKKERAIADAEWDNQLQELQRYKRAMVAEEEIHPRAGYI